MFLIHKKLSKANSVDFFFFFFISNRDGFND
jgi:hypothetical protein